MLASRPAPASIEPPVVRVGPEPGRVAWIVAPLMALGCIGWLYIRNPRLWGSWHGFLHSAIATRFSEAAFPPENPFFAGEPLPYYWVYQLAGYWFSRLSSLDPLRTFHAMSWISLAAFILIAGRIGHARFRSTTVGLAIAVLGLVGLNPLGPAIALAKHFVRGTPLVRSAPAAVETTFVTNEAADDLMTEPLLPAMYIGGDWRRGQNVVWFFDAGSRAPALAGLLLIAGVLLTPGGGWRRRAGVAALSAIVAALNPLIGLGGCGALALAAFLVRRSRDWMFSAAAGVGGAMAALPTYYQIFGRSGGPNVSLHHSAALPVIVIAANFALLLPLAIAGVRRSGYRLMTLTTAGALLLLFAMTVRLPEGNEHNLINAAQCLLAIPAGAVVTTRRALTGVLLTFLPVTACALSAFAARPPIPIGVSGRVLARTPADSDLQRLYQWIRSNTPSNSILVTDPDSPVKMSGNVSEIPALTARTLFTDTPSYLTTPNRDADLRRRIAKRTVAGERLSADEAQYLDRFGRPVYALSFRPETNGVLSGLYGAPAFRLPSAAVFTVRGGRNGE